MIPAPSSDTKGKHRLNCLNTRYDYNYLTKNSSVKVSMQSPPSSLLQVIAVAEASMAVILIFNQYQS